MLYIILKGYRILLLTWRTVANAYASGLNKKIKWWNLHLYLAFTLKSLLGSSTPISARSQQMSNYSIVKKGKFMLQPWQFCLFPQQTPWKEKHTRIPLIPSIFMLPCLANKWHPWQKSKWTFRPLIVIHIHSYPFPQKHSTPSSIISHILHIFHTSFRYLRQSSILQLWFYSCGLDSDMSSLYKSWFSDEFW